MGPAFANLLEIGGDQYEYIQSVIAHDFLLAYLWRPLSWQQSD